MTDDARRPRRPDEGEAEDYGPPLFAETTTTTTTPTVCRSVRPTPARCRTGPNRPRARCPARSPRPHHRIPAMTSMSGRRLPERRPCGAMTNQSTLTTRPTRSSGSSRSRRLPTRSTTSPTATIPFRCGASQAESRSAPIRPMTARVRYPARAGPASRRAAGARPARARPHDRRHGRRSRVTDATFRQPSVSASCSQSCSWSRSWSVQSSCWPWLSRCSASDPSSTSTRSPKRATDQPR